jgi:predicted nucleotidyltransferase
MEHTNQPLASLPSTFVTQLLPTLDDSTVTAIILHGSYARGEAVPPYSDIDLVRILKETPERRQHKRFLWWESFLLNLSSRPLSIYQDWLLQPQEAIFRITTLQDALILIDKEGIFQAFQQELRASWQWEPLQEAANRYVSQQLVELSETMLRLLRGLRLDDPVMQIQRIVHHVLPTVTEAIAVQRGLLIRNRYLQRVQEAVGKDSRWTQLYMQAAGVPLHDESLVLPVRSRAALRLYQETVHLLRSALLAEHRATIDVLLGMIDQQLDEQIAS